MPQEESEPKTVTPFKLINRGEDTVVDDQVVFADFSPRVIPASVPDEEIDEIAAPKDVSAPEPVVPPESTLPTEPTSSTTSVPTHVDEAESKNERNETTSQSSSTGRKNGRDTQPA